VIWVDMEETTRSAELEGLVRLHINPRGGLSERPFGLVWSARRALVSCGLSRTSVERHTLTTMSWVACAGVDRDRAACAGAPTIDSGLLDAALQRPRSLPTAAVASGLPPGACAAGLPQVVRRDAVRGVRHRLPTGREVVQAAVGASLEQEPLPVQRPPHAVPWERNPVSISPSLL
jgi:hypothetical protein